MPSTGTSKTLRQFIRGTEGRCARGRSHQARGKGGTTGGTRAGRTMLEGRCDHLHHCANASAPAPVQSMLVLQSGCAEDNFVFRTIASVLMAGARMAARGGGRKTTLLLLPLLSSSSSADAVNDHNETNAHGGQRCRWSSYHRGGTNNGDNDRGGRNVGTVADHRTSAYRERTLCAKDSITHANCYRRITS